MQDHRFFLGQVLTLACWFFLGSATSTIRLSRGNDKTGNIVGGRGSDGIEVVSVLEVEDLQAHESPVL